MKATFVRSGLAVLLFAAGAWWPAKADDLAPKPQPWTNGCWADPGFFPIAVWLQNPVNAEKFRQAGINIYVGLWKGPTEEQLTALNKAGMRVICSPNRTGLRHLTDPIIIGWMHNDEPDNGQSFGARFGFGSPIPPEKIVRTYHELKVQDPLRPVLLCLGQGVAWDGWYGRGRRNQHPEDYPEYLKGCDIASFDIYPANHDSPEVDGHLEFVAHGVDRLVQWSRPGQTVWNCIECTAIADPKRKPTPHQVRAEAWMSLIHGSHSLIYFVHQFKPVFDEAALLDDPEMLEAITRLNRQIAGLAPVLNRVSLPDAVTVHSENRDVPVAVMVKQYADATYLFAVGMHDGATDATFSFKNIEGTNRVEVLDEGRSLSATQGSFRDHFTPWSVHLYKLPATVKP